MNGLCLCGCGNAAPIAKRNSAQRGYTKGEPKAFIKGHHQRGDKHPNWHGGATRQSKGYILILARSHPRANKRGYVYEHVLVAEKAFGRHLPGNAVVHHHDEIKDHNSSGNLVICENGNYHRLLHKRMRALEACGNVNAEVCVYCGSYDRQGDIFIYTKKSGLTRGYHKNCENAHHRRRRYQEKKGVPK